MLVESVLVRQRIAQITHRRLIEFPAPLFTPLKRISQVLATSNKETFFLQGTKQAIKYPQVRRFDTSERIRR
ncbi:Uncharacterised protein [Serratia proteamaculans]|nr:Uncharacterised protein [Serratia proteamaculans]